AQGVYELLYGGRLRVGQINLIIQLLAQGAPVEFHKRMFLADGANNFVGDAGAIAEPREMELPHFSTAAYVVHQVVGVSFAANKSHRGTSAKLPYRGSSRRKRVAFSPSGVCSVS